MVVCHEHGRHPPRRWGRQRVRRAETSCSRNSGAAPSSAGHSRPSRPADSTRWPSSSAQSIWRRSCRRGSASSRMPTGRRGRLVPCKPPCRGRVHETRGHRGRLGGPTSGSGVSVGGGGVGAQPDSCSDVRGSASTPGSVSTRGVAAVAHGGGRGRACSWASDRIWCEK